VLLSARVVKPRITGGFELRISELSRRSGVPVPTIKYYLREGLLPAGTPTARNLADYGEDHHHRLRLIRVLMEVGGLRVASVRRVLEAIGNERLPIHRVLGVAHHALGPPPDTGPVPEDVARARSEVDGFLADLGWKVSEKAPARRALADALVALRRLGLGYEVEVLRPYANLADELAGWELGQVRAGSSRADAVESAIVGTVVFEAALMALRRLAQEHHSATRFGRGRILGAG
jgi:DNA-binding transcriptional MerR regulator